MSERGNHWKGGRVVAGGYVYIWAPTHPMAHSTGYVPEHRFVMARTLGRLLAPEEVVHHVNGDRTDNRPENLEVMTRGAHNSTHGRRRDLRPQGADNPMVACACGCGAWFPRYDIQGRPRTVALGHGRRAQRIRLEREP